MARHMERGCVLGLRDRGSTLAAGTLDSRCLGSTPGQVEVSTKATGRMGNDMDWGWSLGGDGSTGGSGHRGSRGDMEFDNRQQQQQNTRELGQTDCKMDMARRHTQMGYVPGPVAPWNAPRLRC